MKEFWQSFKEFCSDINECRLKQNLTSVWLANLRSFYCRKQLALLLRSSLWIQFNVTLCNWFCSQVSLGLRIGQLFFQPALPNSLPVSQSLPCGMQALVYLVIYSLFTEHYYQEINVSINIYASSTININSIILMFGWNIISFNW